MSRESRIQEALRRAAETSDERAEKRAAEATERSNRIAAMGNSAARNEASRIARDNSIGYLGPSSTPHEWSKALQAAREVVLESARRRETLTYGELQVAAYEGSGLKIGHSMYGTFCMELNDPGKDDCLISAIVVTTDTGRPGEGLLPFARELGMDEPVETLQRRVFERFAGPDLPEIADTPGT